MRKSLQYISDLHIDRLPIGKIPKIKPISETILISGDIGSILHPNFKYFFKYLNNEFHRIYFVPGNHEYDTSSCFSQIKYNIYQPQLEDLAKSHNINLLNCQKYNLDDNTIIAGTTLWSNPDYKLNHQSDNEFNKHITQHQQEVQWLKNLINNNPNKKIIIGTHFVPTVKLIEPKYYINNKPSKWFYTNLEYLIKEPIIGWFCGHSHSNIITHINNVKCGINIDVTKEQIFLYN
jgi:hypothetical protein